MASAFERALADLVGGYEGGFALWLVCLMRLELAVQDARGFDFFHAHPDAAWNRLLTGIDDALRTGEVGVELERLLQAEGDEVPDEKRRADVAELLLLRARELKDARLNMPPEEWEQFSPRNRRR